MPEATAGLTMVLLCLLEPPIVILGTRCLAQAALDGPSICAALGAVGLDHALLSASDGLVPFDLRSVPALAVRATWDQRSLGIAAASASGCRQLALEPPLDDELDLDGVCRVLYDFVRGQPGLSLAVVTPASGLLADPLVLGLVLDDLAALDIRWWHVPSRVALAEGDDLPWFERLGAFLTGISLDDVAGGKAGLPPGLGGLDLSLLAELTGRGVQATLDPDPVPDPALLKSAVEALRTAGFP